MVRWHISSHAEHGPGHGAPQPHRAQLRALSCMYLQTSPHLVWKQKRVRLLYLWHLTEVFLHLAFWGMQAFLQKAPLAVSKGPTGPHLPMLSAPLFRCRR